MGNAYCYGRKCEPGWGYDELLKKLIPIDGTPPNIISKNDNTSIYKFFDLSSTDIEYFVSLLSSKHVYFYGLGKYKFLLGEYMQTNIGFSNSF